MLDMKRRTCNTTCRSCNNGMVALAVVHQLMKWAMEKDRTWRRWPRTVLTSWCTVAKLSTSISPGTCTEPSSQTRPCFRGARQSQRPSV